MALPTYIDVHDLEDRLGISLSDTREGALQQCADGASRWVDKQTARRFYATTETRFYTARWHYPRGGFGMGGYGDYPWGYPERVNGGGMAGQHVAIDDFVTVTAVLTDDNGDRTFPTTWTSGTDYWLGPRNAAADLKPYRSINRNQVSGRYAFPPWENSISITGSAGYSTTVPDGIREVTMFVAMLFARPVIEMSIPGVSSYKTGPDISMTMAPEELPPYMREILQQFIDPVFSI